MVTRRRGQRRRVQLVAARKAVGFTQEELAVALGVDRSTVFRWEAGVRVPLPYLRPKLAGLLRVTRDQLQVLLDGANPPAIHPASPASDNQAVSSEDMKRRTLVKWGLTAGTAATLGGAGSTVRMADVARLQRSAARLHSLDQQHGGDSLWQAALAQAHAGVQLLEYATYTDVVGRHLLQATGQLHICAGWMAFDAGHQEVARTCFTDALAMSRQADDAQIETRALANLALQSNALTRPREALRYAFGAEHSAGRSGAAPWLAAIPQLRLAIGKSLTGEARDADHAIGAARHVLERCDDATNEEWSSFLSFLEIDAVEATCAVQLGQHRRAVQLLEHAIAGYSRQCARNLALYRVRLARARLETGAVEGAVEAAHAALDDLCGDVASWRVNGELAAVARQLKPYTATQGVDSFITRYHNARA
jgi:transcriptional regulator with XRE-family HTH domain/tetratricopeptide (TPR) repeat protein